MYIGTSYIVGRLGAKSFVGNILKNDYIYYYIIFYVTPSNMPQQYNIKNNVTCVHTRHLQQSRRRRSVDFLKYFNIRL